MSKIFDKKIIEQCLISEFHLEEGEDVYSISETHNDIRVTFKYVIRDGEIIVFHCFQESTK